MYLQFDPLTGEQMPDRPPRRMPSARAVAEYWHTRNDLFDIDLDRPRCFRCDGRVPEWNWLDRAHLIDRVNNGLDHAANLVMLCPSCHKRMPSFDNGEDDGALGWVLRLPMWRQFIEPSTTDSDPDHTTGI